MSLETPNKQDKYVPPDASYPHPDPTYADIMRDGRGETEIPTTGVVRRARTLARRCIFLTAGDARVREDVNFSINTIAVDNWTAQWVKVSVGNWFRFCPPQTGGVIVRGPTDTILDVSFESPPGIVQPAEVANQQAQCFLYEEITDLSTATTVA